MCWVAAAAWRSAVMRGLAAAALFLVVFNGESRWLAAEAAAATATSLDAVDSHGPLYFWRGIDMRPAAEAAAAAAGFRKREGMLVERIETGSPAARAGLKPGDIIGALDGIPVGSVRNLALAVADHCCGPTVTLRVWRNQRGRSVKLAPSPASPT